MPRFFALSLTKPYETLGMPKPLITRLPNGLAAWNMLILSLSVAIGVVYIVQVNLAAAKGYVLRNIEKKVEVLKTETLVMQDKIATMSSIQMLNARASELGFMPVENLEFMNPTGKATALAK